MEKMLENEKDLSRRLAASKKSLIHDLTNILFRPNFVDSLNLRVNFSSFVTFDYVTYFVLNISSACACVH